MKNLYYFLVFSFLLTMASLCGGQQAVNGGAIASSSEYSIVAKDADSRVWERTVYEQGTNGQVIPKKHRYVELATGLNHQVNGQWVESKEEIDVLPDGTAAAT